MGGCEGGFWLWNSKKENEKDRQIEETENQAKTKLRMLKIILTILSLIILGK